MSKPNFADLDAKILQYSGPSNLKKATSLSGFSDATSEVPTAPDEPPPLPKDNRPASVENISGAVPTVLSDLNIMRTESIYQEIPSYVTTRPANDYDEIPVYQRAYDFLNTKNA